MRPLEQIQRWMQAVITHPDGPAAGADSAQARREIDIPAEEISRVIEPSRSLSSLGRLAIYANAYYARLLECLREEFPALIHALGEETFDGFAFGYLQAYPSRSYTLNDLGGRFPQYLAETRPQPEAGTSGHADWADFIIDLARLERTYSEVFDGPGFEGERILQAEDLATIPPQRRPEVRLIPVGCLRLLTFSYPVHEYASAVRSGRPAVPPEAETTYLVVTRRDFIVRRCAVSPPEYELLRVLAEGQPLGTAIEEAAAKTDADVETFAASLEQWFRQWSAAGFFRRVELADE